MLTLPGFGFPDAALAPIASYTNERAAPTGLPMKLVSADYWCSIGDARSRCVTVFAVASPMAAATTPSCLRNLIRRWRHWRRL